MYAAGSNGRQAAGRKVVRSAGRCVAVSVETGREEEERTEKSVDEQVAGVGLAGAGGGARERGTRREAEQQIEQQRNVLRRRDEDKVD